ncbi:ATPdependent RNA helicase [Chytriomyces hyalinus]|nr:ATPdependent RNA helicase [Chytriomyces hyalinus]
MGKKSNKSSSASTPAPAPVPAEPVKLTRHQMREQRAKAEAAEKALLFGTWSGATPEQLIKEQCLKMRWSRPAISARKAERGFVGVTVLSKEDPKTSQMRTVKYEDTSKQVPTELEARQWASTFALHRVASHLSLKMSLPPAHQEYWVSLEKIRKTASPDAQKYDYTDDPFTANERKAREQMEQLRLEKEEKEKRARENDKSLRPWEAFQKVSLTAEMRKKIEDLIRDDFGNTDGNTGNGTASGLVPIEMDETERAALVNSLLQKGFLKIHAEEATLYNYDLPSCINWLCIYVPEDDLPFAFHSKVKSEISQGMSTNHSLNRDWAVQHMVHSGFSADICQRAYDENNCNELDALAHLFKQFAFSDTETEAAEVDPASIDKEELILTRQEELEALESIYGSEAIVRDKEHHMISIKISNDSESLHQNVSLSVGFSVSSVYPYELPAIMITCAEIPAYIRLSMLKCLAIEAKSWIGMPMIFEAVNWVETNLHDFVSNPKVSLVDLKNALMKSERGGVKSGTGGAGDAKVTSKSKSSRKNLASKVLSPEESAVAGKLLQEKFLQKANSQEYKKMRTIRDRLPSFKFRDEIIQATASNKVVIICGETGCGKSTQTGQFLLEHLLSTGQGGSTNIICTQPRRISAISLAERVAAEMAEQVGKTVGYNIRGESVRSADTKLTFCTTGILLRMLQGDPSVNHVSHIIVDEVHERSVDSDFLLVILRQLITRRNDIHVILMSATINSELFSSYFSGAPVLNIPGFTHPVQDVYLDEALRLTNYVPEAYKYRPSQDANEPESTPATSNSLNSKAASWVLRKESPNNPVDYSLISAIIRYVCETADNEGAVLVFLQGAMEIKRCIDTIQSEIGAMFRLDLIPLHSQLSARDQAKVFRRPAKGVRKIVVSTNVAETSITIEDVVYVVDAGRVKEMRYENSTLCLMETLASKASCKQRRGRAGRVRPGFCFKLFSKGFENREMSDHSVPEILRVPLEQLCLTLKAMGVLNVEEFLGDAIDPPSANNISSAVSLLHDLNAVDRVSGELTSLGRHIATIPADLRIAKMLIFGCIFHCISPVLTIAAILSSKSPFVIPHDKRAEGQAARKNYMWEKSDLLTDCKAYDAWVEACKKGKKSEMMFCDENFMSSNTLVSISDLRRQYLDTLMDIGFIKRSDLNSAISGDGPINKFSTNGRMVKSAIAAGLYPQLATVQHPDVLYMETAHGTMARDHDAKLIRFFTATQEVFLHPSSCMSSVSLYEDLVVMYHSKVLTSKVYLRDATMVSPWAVLMFGGELCVDMEGRTLAVSELVKFQAFPRIAVLVNGLRKQLDRLLALKVEQPDMDALETPLGAVLTELLSV